MSERRLKHPHDDALRPAQRDAMAAFEAERGYRVHGPFDVMLHAPDLMMRAAKLGSHVRLNNALPKRLSEFAILITARHWRQDFEWSHHRPHALEAGLDEALIEDLALGLRPRAMDDDAALVYSFCSELLVNRSVSDPTFAAAEARFSAEGVVDLTGVCGYYSLLAMMLNVARIGGDESAAPLPALP